MRIGLFGGTFDPIHIGHLVLATVAIEESNLDRILFMPAGVPPHKLGKEISDGAHRLEMVRLAVEREPRFEVSDWEIKRNEVSFTLDTVKWLRNAYPQDELFFIVGADMLADLPNWHHPEQIVEYVTILAVPRPGYETAAKEIWEQFPSSIQQRIILLNAPEIEIASTWIRTRIQNGKSVHYLLPEEVEHYIFENGLYSGMEVDAGGALKSPAQTSSTAQDWKSVEQRVKERALQELSSYRFKHVEGVVETAEKLAKHYALDTAKMRVAAWLHDVAREWPEEKLRYEADRLGIEKMFYEPAELLHGPMMAKLAGQWFGIYDQDILSAVKYHTCGRVDMSKFEKVLCLADAIEPGRLYPGVDEVRQLAYESLEKALAVQFDGTISYLLQRKKPIFTYTVLARNQWWKQVE